MDWKALLTSQMAHEYRATERLMGKLSDADLGWKPSAGLNWMTAGQLLDHLAESCGMLFTGFILGQWPFPAGADPHEKKKPEEMLPPAEAMRAETSVAHAVARLKADHEAALAALAACDDARFADPTPAPWDPSPMCLGERLMTGVGHLASHKSQLFYYLKLMGQPVHTGDLWGM